MNAPISIEKFVEDLRNDYVAKRLKMPFNSFNSTMKDVGWLEKGPLGLDCRLDQFTVQHAETVMLQVIFGEGRRKDKKQLSTTGAASVYYSLHRLFDLAKDKKYPYQYITENPFDKIRPGLKPHVSKTSKKTEAVAFTKEDGEKLVHALIHTNPTFSAVKATLFTYMAYRHRKTPGGLLLMTWDEFEASKMTEKDPFLATLSTNYRAALEKWCKDNEVDNTEGLFFVKFKGGCLAEPMDAGFVGSWLKKNVFETNKGLTKVTTNTLCGKNTPRDVFAEVDAGGDFEILGEITFPVIGLTGKSSFDYEAYEADRKACEELFKALKNPKEETDNG